MIEGGPGVERVSVPGSQPPSQALHSWSGLERGASRPGPSRTVLVFIRIERPPSRRPLPGPRGRGDS